MNLILISIPKSKRKTENYEQISDSYLKLIRISNLRRKTEKNINVKTSRKSDIELT